MIRRVVILLILSLFSLILISCIFEADREDFSFELIVKDTAGNPVDGLNVALLNNIGNYSEDRVSYQSRAQTTISFDLGIAAHCSIIIKDIKKNIVRNLLSDDLSAGLYSVTWNGKSDDEIDLPSGLYYCQMTAMNEGEMFYKEDHTMYLQSYHNKYGNTDATGSFQIEDKKPFINLFNTGPLLIVDEDGFYLGSDSFSQTTVICLYEGNNPQFIQMENVIVKNKKNKFELIWDPENRATEFHESADEIGHEQNPEVTRGSDDDVVPSDDAELIGSYPNPFN